MANSNINQLPTHPVERSVYLLNQRLDFTTRETALSYTNAPCYGGYRLEAKGGSTGFAYNNGTEKRLSRKEFLIYLKGLHDMLDHFVLTRAVA
jgi:hypothetical protein